MSGFLEDRRKDVQRDKKERATDGWIQRCVDLRREIARESEVEQKGGNQSTYRELAILLEACTTYILTSELSLKGNWQDDLEYWRRSIVREGGRVDDLMVAMAAVLLRAKRRPLYPDPHLKRLDRRDVERLIALLKSRLDITEL